MSNEILDEIRRVRDEMARECDYDVHKLSKMIGEGTEKLKAEGWKFVSPKPRALRKSAPSTEVFKGADTVRPSIVADSMKGKK